MRKQRAKRSRRHMPNARMRILNSLPEGSYLLKAEVAGLLRITERTLEKWMRLGRVPFIK